MQVLRSKHQNRRMSDCAEFNPRESLCIKLETYRIPITNDGFDGVIHPFLLIWVHSEKGKCHSERSRRCLCNEIVNVRIRLRNVSHHVQRKSATRGVNSIITSNALAAHKYKTVPDDFIVR